MNTDVAITSSENPDPLSLQMEHLRSSIHFPNRAGQFVLLLLRAIRTMWDNERIHKEPFQPERQEVFKHIQKEQLLELQQEDWKPFPSVESSGGKEPRWQTVISWARDHCVKLGFIMNDEKGLWWPTPPGLNASVHARRMFERQEWSVRDAHWWSPKLKALFDPAYQPSPSDAPRPEFPYEDHLPEWLCSVGGRDSRKALVEYDAVIQLVQSKWDAMIFEKRQKFIAKLAIVLDTAATKSDVIAAIRARYRPPVLVSLDEFL